MKKLILVAAFAALIFSGCTSSDVLAFAKERAIQFTKDQNISAKSAQICWNTGTDPISCDGIDTLCKTFSKDIIKSHEGALHVRVVYSEDKAECSFNSEMIDLY